MSDSAKVLTTHSLIAMKSRGPNEAHSFQK